VPVGARGGQILQNIHRWDLITAAHLIHLAISTTEDRKMKCKDCQREDGNCKEYCSAQYEVSSVPFATVILAMTFVILWVVL